MLTALLAKRMNNFIGKYIKANQSGFILGRQIADLTRRIVNIIDIIVKQKLKAGIILLDIFKVFDYVAWRHKNTDRYIRIWEPFQKFVKSTLFREHCYGISKCWINRY